MRSTCIAPAAWWFCTTTPVSLVCALRSTRSASTAWRSCTATPVSCGLCPAQHTQRVNCLAVLHDDTHAVTCGEDCGIKAADISTGATRAQWQTMAPPRALAVAQDQVGQSWWGSQGWLGQSWWGSQGCVWPYCTIPP